MSSINVTSAQPRRLLYIHDEWTLEVQRWHAIDRDLFAPIQSYIPGPENILRYLTELDHQGHLLAQAERILSHTGSPNTAFEAQEGHWIAQTTIVELTTPRSAPANPTPAPAPQASELSQILEHLTSLEQRLERLEVRLQGRVADNDGPTPSVRPMNEEPPLASESTDNEAEPVSQTG